MKIAVTDTGKSEKQKLYMDWLQSFNPHVELVVVSYRKGNSDISDYDGLVLTGGEDVDPKLSKASPVELVQQVDRLRDDFEFRMLENAMKHQVPIFGICRGLQVINVFLGGTLISDLPSAGYQSHTGKKNEPELRHAVTVSNNTLLNTITGVPKGEINSFHHQSVLSPADDLIVTGLSDDNVIESMEWKEKKGKSFLLLVQWHPERMHDTANPFTTNIGKTFFTEAQKFNSMK